MTIKKRLFISNILMIVIPAIISFATVWISAFIIDLLSDGEMDILGRRGGGLYARTDDIIQAVLLSLLVVAFLCVIMFLTNKLLTKFVFSKIVQPLELLSSGVQHISKGDLDYRIDYLVQDEFKPVCEAFNDMGAQLKSSAEEIKKNEQNRKELFASISHDLRSPLTSIKAFVEGLLDGIANTPESQQEYLQIIKQKTEDINNMVSQLFLYSKMDMGNYPTNPEKIDIGKEIRDFVSASEEEFKVKGLLIKTSDLPAESYIYADPIQLRSIFANILDNSARYKPKDTIDATIYCMTADEAVNIVIEDNGVGVSDEAIPKLFDAFYRADSSRTKPSQGSGLGLAIALKALERMGGSIRAENVNNGGLRVIMRIPLIQEKTKESFPYEESFNN